MFPSQLVDVVLEEETDRTDKWRKKFKPMDGADAVAVAPADAFVAGLDLKKKLPEAFLSECTIEVCKDPRQKKIAPKLNFEVQITPVYKYNQRREKGVVETDETDVHDILSEVEAVYSEHESDGDDDMADAADMADMADEEDTPSSPEPPTSETTVTTSSGLRQIAQDKKPQFKPTFRCDHCPNVYGNRGALWQHSVAAHSVRKNCQCAICGRKFYRNCSLALHLKSHHNDQQHLLHLQQVQQQQQRRPSAERAEKGFDLDDLGQEAAQTQAQPSPAGTSPQADQLQSSAVSSAAPAGSRPYQCQFCKKCYSQKSVLKKHLVIHTGERLTCALCGSTSRRSRRCCATSRGCTRSAAAGEAAQ